MSTNSLPSVSNVSIEAELKQSYLDYAMSVIVGRALPDVRDGLKPVHRRVLYAMYQLNNVWNKPHKKSARVVGDVIGKYHPHGDVAVYDAIVRMAQSFSMRYPIIDGQGNFGSVDGDAPAAMRYTEVRMSQLTSCFLDGIDQETVDFTPNYDGSEQIPEVLPAQVPNLLINGSSGIAVGMATNIPPHNLGEVIDACVALNANPELEIDELIRLLPGPDFPTAGIIYGRAGMIEALKTGRGKIVLRGRAHYEQNNNNHKESIIVTELPYQVNKARFVERIAELVRIKKLEGITALRDESDKQGMRVVIEVRRGDNSAVVLNNLYLHTQLQSSFAVNMVALRDGQPQLLNIKEILTAFLAHRRVVITRRTLFELRQALHRAHIVLGMAMALDHIDQVISIIRAAPDPKSAKQSLIDMWWPVNNKLLSMLALDAKAADLVGVESCPANQVQDSSCRLSALQAQAILDMRLHRLTALEQDKVMADYQELSNKINGFEAILRDEKKLLAVVDQELLAIKEQFADQRLTEIVNDDAELNTLDLVNKEDIIVTLSRAGYIKIEPLSLQRAQHRGGVGRVLTTLRAEDVVESLFIANSHDVILCFSNSGMVYWLKLYELPEDVRSGRGRPLVNLLPLAKDEKIQAILPVSTYCDDRYVVMATARGLIKKVRLSRFARPRRSGIIATMLDPGDDLIGVEISNGNQDIMLFTSAGKVMRFPESGVRPLGRKSRGVKGVSIAADARVVSLLVVDSSSADIISVTANGYGNRTNIDSYRITRRGAKGVMSIKVNNRNGEVISATQVATGDEIVLINNKGTVIRMLVDEISLVARNTQGVRLIKLGAQESLVGLKKVWSCQL